MGCEFQETRASKVPTLQIVVLYKVVEPPLPITITQRYFVEHTLSDVLCKQ